jgi:hypothetical protein
MNFEAASFLIISFLVTCTSIAKINTPIRKTAQLSNKYLTHVLWFIFVSVRQEHVELH